MFISCGISSQLHVSCLEFLLLWCLLMILSWSRFSDFLRDEKRTRENSSFYSCSTGPVYMGLPVKLKLFSVILHYQYLSTKLLSSAPQHRTMFHKNDIDRNRNNMRCVGGRRSPKHSIDSASPAPGTSFECFRLRSPPIWNCYHHYGQKWRIHNNQPNVRPPNCCCYPRGWWYLWVLRRRRLMRGWFGGCRWCFVSMRPWWFIFRPFLGWVCESQADDAGLCTFCTIDESFSQLFFRWSLHMVYLIQLFFFDVSCNFLNDQN